MSTLKVDTVQSADGTKDLLSYDSSTGAVSGVNLGRRNLIINGAMQVAQRGTSEIGTSNYLLDRWRKHSATNANVTFSQDTADTPDGFRYAFKALATGASNFIQLGQPIEFKNMAHTVGKKVTLSYWAKTNLSFYSRIRSRTDTEDAVTVFSATTLSVITESASTDWKLFTHTFTVPSATLAMSVDFSTGALVSGDYFQITGVQLEVGSVATPFEHRSYGEELALCQRYYWGWNAAGHSAANCSAYARWLTVATSTSRARWFPSHPVEMRASPTLIGSTSAANFQITDYSDNGTATFSGLSVQEGSNFHSQVSFDMTAADLNQGATVSIRWANNPIAYIGFDAEL